MLTPSQYDCRLEQSTAKFLTEFLHEKNCLSESSKDTNLKNQYKKFQEAFEKNFRNVANEKADSRWNWENCPKMPESCLLD